MNENQLSKLVIGKAIEVHKSLGPGLLESTYLECLDYELRNEHLRVERQKPMPIIYKEVKLDHGYRIDLLINDKLVLELKSVETINDIHKAQLLTYLKLNFNVKLLSHGIKRIVNSL